MDAAVVVPVVVAVVAGVASSLLAPWAKYGVDARRCRTENRQGLVADWWAMIVEHHQPTDGPVRLRSGHCPVVDDRRFPSLRPHLEPQLLRRPETTGDAPEQALMASAYITVNVGSYGLDPDLRAVSDAVDGLERKWRLV